RLRLQYLAVLGPRCVHTGPPPARTGPASRAAPSRSHRGCSAGSSGSRPSGTSRNGIGSAALVATIAAAQRCARPTWGISCRRVQSGQVGTRAGRAAWLAISASVAALPVPPAGRRSVGVLPGLPPPAPPRAPAAPPAPAAGRGAGRARPAADRHGGQQFHRVVVSLRAPGRVGGLGHGPAALEGRAASAAAVLIPWHASSLLHPGAVRQGWRGARRRRGTAGRRGSAGGPGLVLVVELPAAQQGGPRPHPRPPAPPP